MTKQKEKLTDPALIRFAEGLQHTWDQCGDDLCFNEVGERDYTKTFTQDEVYEICADLYVGMMNYEDMELWWCLTDEDKEALKLAAFPGNCWGY